MTRLPAPHPVLGFYGPGTQMWRINREAVLLGAGPAALLLQIAHPLVAEGVAQHSRFEEDPFARLRATLRTTMDLVFGDGPTAEAALRRLNGVHATIRGEVADDVARAATGATAYRAMDPSLLLWVQATLIVTSVRAYERWVGPVTDADRERFWQEARAVGPRMGIPADRSPQDWRQLMAYWDEMLAPDGPIQVSPTARRLSPSILRPPLPMTPPAIVGLINLPGLSLVPDRIREGFGIDWTPRHERMARGLGLAVRGWVRAMPPGWRAMPQARAAARRAHSASIESAKPILQEPARA
ncbi:MAG: hypothetical protein QOH61_997 [Chloroflexota bacterium]|jgi:uncharacterized protein (DUF2236 family)|nr:hypothetical protein [Chloroflexota bacterium]